MAEDNRNTSTGPNVDPAKGKGKGQRLRLQIQDNWYVDEISTLDECDTAFLFLTDAIARMEAQLSDPVRCEDREWRFKATFSLRLKKAAMNAVQAQRGRISRRIKEETHAATLAASRERNARIAAEYARRHPEEFRLLAEQIDDSAARN